MDFNATSLSTYDFSTLYTTLTHILHCVFFVGHGQTVHTQIRRRRMQRLIRVSTVCLQNILLEILNKNDKYDPTTLVTEWTVSIAKH